MFKKTDSLKSKEWDCYELIIQFKGALKKKTDGNICAWR